MSQPPIIGSGKPHTVSLKPGSNVAVSTPRRGPEDTGTAGNERRDARLRTQADPARAARPATGDARQAPVRAAAPTTRPAPAQAPAGLSDALLQRIEQLKQRNTVVGQALASLPDL